MSIEILSANERQVLSIGCKIDGKQHTVLFFMESKQFMVLDVSNVALHQWGKWVITDENHILISNFKNLDHGYKGLHEVIEKEVFKWLAERELLKNSADTTINNIQQGSNDEQSTPKSD